MVVSLIVLSCPHLVTLKLSKGDRVMSIALSEESGESKSGSCSLHLATRLLQPSGRLVNDPGGYWMVIT